MFVYQDVKDRTETLSKGQLTMIMRVLLEWQDSINPEEDMLSPGQALLIWLADLIEWMQLCSSDERTLFLQEIKVELSSFAECLETSINAQEDALPAFMVGFVDRRYATCSVMKQFFDMREGVWIDKLPEPALETISYSCTTLYMRNYHIIQESHGRSPDGEHS